MNDFTQERRGPADIYQPMTRWSRHRLAPRFLAPVVAALTVATLALGGALPLAGAATLSGGAGVDYSAGPNSQSYRGALLFGAASANMGDLTLAGIRYDQSVTGEGYGAFASAGLKVGSTLKFRGTGVRLIGDEDLRAWRLRAGPEWSLSPRVTLGGAYLHYIDGGSTSFRGGSVEATVPLSTGLSGQVGSSYGTWEGGATTAQGILGASWQAAPRIQLLCEVDVGRNVITTSSTSSGGQVGGGMLGNLPILGQGQGTGGSTQSTTEHSTSATGQIGMRFSIP
jgi:hypothetical protein